MQVAGAIEGIFGRSCPCMLPRWEFKIGSLITRACRVSMRHFAAKNGFQDADVRFQTQAQAIEYEC
jgi:hypothetical protein